MSHLYPLAETADQALSYPDRVARTRYEAEELAEEREIVALETEWLKPQEANVLALIDAADAGPGQGFVQRYEDADGKPVLAVTYWKLGQVTQKPKVKSKSAPKPPAAEDHTDDLYFRDGRTKPSKKRRGRKKHIDPNQMDLFGVEPDDTKPSTH